MQRETDAETKRPDVLAESVLRAAGLSVDDLKSLETVFRELAASFGTRFAGQTDLAVGAELAEVRTLEKDAIGAALGQCALICLVPVAKWGSRVVLAADRSFVDFGTEAMFGARVSAGVVDAARPLTSVDLGVARQVFAYVTASLDHMFGAGAEPIFHIGELMEAAHLAQNAVTETRMISCVVTLKAAGRSGQFRILLPRSSFRPMQDAIARMLRQPAHHSDPAWAKKLRLEVSRARIDVEAYLLQGSMTLEQIALLHVGQILQLPKDAIDQVRLRGGHQALYKCRLGKAGNAFTVRITDPVNEEEDLLDELAAG